MEKFDIKKTNEPNYYQRVKRVEKEGPISRRDFLKRLGALAAGAAAGHLISKRFFLDGEKEQVGDDRHEKANILDKSGKPTNDRRPKAVSAEETKDEDEIDFDEHINKVMDIDKFEKIEIGPDVAKATEEFWFKKYSDRKSKLGRSLIEAYGKMQGRMDQLGKIFSKYKVPQEYIFLAVPESHWKNEVSPAGAAGVYQIMPRTARDYELVVD